MRLKHTAVKPTSYLGQVVGSGQCVAYVQKCSTLGPTGSWLQGALVKGNKEIQPNTVIATFVDGKYASKTDGSSHAAVYLSQDATGIWVYDQWKGQKVHKRCIRFNGAARKATAVNDGDRYYVVETETK